MTTVRAKMERAAAAAVVAVPFAVLYHFLCSNCEQTEMQVSRNQEQGRQC